MGRAWGWYLAESLARSHWCVPTHPHTQTHTHTHNTHTHTHTAGNTLERTAPREKREQGADGADTSSVEDMEGPEAYGQGAFSLICSFM